MYESLFDEFDAADGRVTYHTSSVGPYTLVYDVPLIGLESRLQDNSNLIAARVHLLDPNAMSQPIFTIDGPAIVIPENGNLIAIGNGVVGIVEIGRHDFDLLPIGLHTPVKPGEVLVVPQGRTSFYKGERRGTDIEVVGAVRTISATPLVFQTESERQHHLGISFAMQQETGTTTSLWFGSVEVLESTPIRIAAGWIELDFGWLIVPQCEEVQASCVDTDMILWSPASGRQISSTLNTESLTIYNDGDATAIVAYTRFSHSDGQA